MSSVDSGRKRNSLDTKMEVQGSDVRSCEEKLERRISGRWVRSGVVLSCNGGQHSIPQRFLLLHESGFPVSVYRANSDRRLDSFNCTLSFPVSPWGMTTRSRQLKTKRVSENGIELVDVL